MNLCSNGKNPFTGRMSAGPIKWLEWDDETLKRAADLDRPICLCVINNTSRWSHAMKDNFGHDEIVKMLNNDFIPVMVDCVDAPHLALAARATSQIMMGYSGWPLFLFLTPSKKPIFAAAYMPTDSEDTHVPGLLQVLRRIKWLWLMKRSQLNFSADSYGIQLEGALHPYTAPAPDRLAELAATRLLEDEDVRNGGFGGAPKFPHASKLLLAAWLIENGTESEKLSSLFDRALTTIASGGLYDHIGGGFHDYCRDGEWKQPYLGKHLEQNTAILLAFIEGARILKKPFCNRIIEETLSAIVRAFDLGGLLSSGEDVGSSQEVDPYYLWDFDEIGEVLGESAEAFRSAFGVTREGNYAAPLTQQPTRKNVLNMTGHGQEELAYLFFDEKKKLLQARSGRRIPELEKRIPVRGNAAFAALLARVARILGMSDCLDQAAKLLETLLNEAVHDGKLCHMLYDGAPHGQASLDDVASLVWACIELYRAGHEDRWLEAAKEWSHRADELFGSEGAMRLTPEASTDIVPTWEGGDDTLPSGNGVMLNNLVTLASLTGEKGWEDRAGQIVHAFGGALAEYPCVCAFLTVGALRLQALNASKK